MDKKIFCQYLYASNYVPVTYITNDHTVFSCGVPEGFAIENMLKIRFSDVSRPTIFLNPDDDGLYGIIPTLSVDELILLGPVYSIFVGEKTLQKFKAAHDWPMEHEILRQFLRAIPTYSYSHFANLILFVSLILTNEVHDIFQPENFGDIKVTTEIASKHIRAVYSSQIEQKYHGTYSFEQQLLGYVKQGNTSGLKELLSNFPKQNYMSEGELAGDPLRQMKNIFIGNITLIGKNAAIPGGMDVEETYQLIDTYIQECEKLHSVDDVQKLQYNMLLDFTNRVVQVSIPATVSATVFKCLEFIDIHYIDNISILDITEHLKLSKSYISKHFKEDVGMTIGEYILNKKIEHAKTLLAYTDKSLSEISEHLNFSSQSYFHNVFRRTVGITPKVYRQKI